MFGQLFDGNKDRNTIVYQTLSQPIGARYVRILPEAWNNHISMRMELYGCSGICFKKLPQDCSFRGLHTIMGFQVIQSSNPNCSESCRDQLQFKFFKVTRLNKTFDKAEHTWRQKARPTVQLILNYLENSSGASLFPEEVRRRPSGHSQSPPLLISSSGSSSLLPQKTKKSPARASRSRKLFSST